MRSIDLNQTRARWGQAMYQRLEVTYDGQIECVATDRENLI